MTTTADPDDEPTIPELSPKPALGHVLRVVFYYYDPILALECHEPVGSVCRLTCAEGCEDMSEHDKRHPLIDSGECNAVLWMKRYPEEYCGNDTMFPIHDGMPVTLAWENDTYVWTPLKNEDYVMILGTNQES